MKFDNVPTGLYTRKAMAIMKTMSSMMKDYSDHYTLFISEVVPGVTIRDVYLATHFKMKRGEVVIDSLQMKQFYNSSFGNMSTFCLMPKNEMLKTLACVFKKVIEANLETTTHEFVSNVNLICDVLSGKNISNYNKKQVESIVGQPPSPMTYEVIHSHAELVKELENECQLKIDEVRRKANAEIAKIKSIYKAKIKDANQTLNTALRGQNV